MNRIAKLVVVGAKDEEAALLRARLADLVAEIAVEASPALGYDAVRRHEATAVLLYLDAAPGPILDLSRRISTSTGLSPMIASRSRNPDLILQAMRAGAHDFAYLEPDLADVRRALVELATRSRAPDSDGAEPAGRITVVFGSKGGVGATMLATNLAGALRSGTGGRTRVVLLDLDLHMADVPIFLDLVSCYGWHDLARDLHRLDEGLLRQAVTTHDSGVQVVAQTDPLMDTEGLDAETVGRAISLLRRHFDHLVVDGIRDFGDVALAVLDMADRVLLVVTQDIPSVRNAARRLAILRRLGYGPDKVKIVVNRYLKRADIDSEAVADALSMPVEAEVANDFPTVIRMINQGAMLGAAAPRSQVARDIRELADALRQADAAAHPRRAR